MRELKKLFDNNKRWADERAAADPTFFPRLAAGQNPDYLWIGCADSRVPANEIIGLDPGEVFVHRNVANLVVHTDLNCLSVLQYAVDYLKIKHVMVCGHYGCGGVLAAMGNVQVGLADNWLRNIRDVYALHREELDSIAEAGERADRLVELNVVRQAFNVCNTTIVQNAWARGAELHIHGWVYSLKDGLLRDLGCCVSGPSQLEAIYATPHKAQRP